MSLPSANWNYPTAIRFGAGRIAELPEACRSLGMARPLLVTDPALAGMPMVTEAVAAAGAEPFSAIHPNPVGADVEAGVAAYRAGRHDGVIAFGGGSALDVGKTVAFAAGQSRPLWDFEDREDWWTRADAAAMGATAFQKGLGGMHALSHPIGAVAGTHHGLTNAVLMPYMLAYNRPAIEDRIARLAGYIGLEPSFDAFLGWILDLRRRLSIPHNLAELGVKPGDVARLAAMAEEDPSAGGNPRPFDAAAARRGLTAALGG